MNQLKAYKVPLLITLGLFVFHSFQKDFKNPYERPIAGDAQAYYAYLPAIFIYHDLSYGFVEEINAKYYPPAHQKSFLKPAGNGKVNKTFPGVALLYLPFFLLAHALALIFGLEADGYSNIYQICFDLSLWFYFALALIFMQRILRHLSLRHNAVSWSISVVILATNTVFYSVYDQSVTHIYNLFMVNVFVAFMLDYKRYAKLKSLAISVVFLVLMGITRPTNILVLGLLVFFIPDLNFYKQLILRVFKPLPFFKILLIVLPILSIPFILWKLQTGLWVVYSYGEEGFDFSHPHFREFLFSYIKGWFTYTPIALFILITGFYTLYQSNKKQVFIGVPFMLLLIYVFSSWWCWYYGAGMSQRVMIDYSLILAYLLAQFIQNSSWFSNGFTIKKGAILFVFASTIVLNFTQAYQIRYGILPGGSATKAQYWDNFMVFEKRARVYPHAHWELIEEYPVNLENTSDTNAIKGKTYWVEEDWILNVTNYDHYSASVKFPLHNTRKGSKIKVSFEARARSEIHETRAVFLYNQNSFVFDLSPYVTKDEWIRIEFMVEPNEKIEHLSKLYFWNGGSDEKVEFKTIRIEHYFSEEYL